MTSPFFHTKILCTKIQPKELQDHIPEETQWMDITLDLREMIAIRENLDEDGDPQVTLYSRCDIWTVSGSYEEILPIWEEARAQR
jgi:hypothetical protein